MKLALNILLIILVLMSLAAGAAKLLQVPQEAQFFADAGLGTGVMMALGALQILGAALSVPPKFRKAGAAIMGAGFLASAVIILMTGNMGFAAVSLLPVVLCGVVVVGVSRR